MVLLSGVKIPANAIVDLVLTSLIYGIFFNSYDVEIMLWPILALVFILHILILIKLEKWESDRAVNNAMRKKRLKTSIINLCKKKQ